jgi:hypothetical protein
VGISAVALYGLIIHSVGQMNRPANGKTGMHAALKNDSASDRRRSSGGLHGKSFGAQKAYGLDQLAAVIMEARELAHQDPNAALAWAEQLPDTTKDEGLKVIGKILAERDPLQAVQLAAGFKNPVFHDQYLTEISQAWAQNHPGDVMDWAETQSAPLKGRLQTAIVIEIAQKNPALAADYIASRIGDASTQKDAANTVIYRWAFMDPDAAKEWADDFPDSDFKITAQEMIKNVSERLSEVK